MTQESNPRAVAYTDGSCIGNPGPGGWGVHVELADGRVVELGGGELETTNNRMELRAAIEAVRATRACPAVIVITDSSYVRNGVVDWLSGWKRNGWLTQAKRPVENRELWMALDALVDDRITWQWTRAHVGTPGNERCDQIARWFASSIVRLDVPPARRSIAGAAPKRGGGGGPNQWYISLVDGILARHSHWADCERRVRGARGARYRKVRSPEEERAIIGDWGMSPDDLVGVETS